MINASALSLQTYHTPLGQHKSDSDHTDSHSELFLTLRKMNTLFHSCFFFCIVIVYGTACVRWPSIPTVATGPKSHPAVLLWRRFRQHVSCSVWPTNQNGRAAALAVSSCLHLSDCLLCLSCLAELRCCPWCWIWSTSLECHNWHIMYMKPFRNTHSSWFIRQWRKQYRAYITNCCYYIQDI